MVLGIDIGGTNTKLGLVDDTGVIHHQWSIATDSFKTVESLARHIHQILESKSLLNHIGSIGIGAPNANFHSGNIEYAPNIQWQGIVPLSAVFEQVFSLPVKITNDANAAAIGEMYFGAAKGMNNFISVTLGTGLGSGIVCNGNPLYGHTGLAAELGHLIIEPNGRQCACGRRGCLERYASATGMMITVDELTHQANQPTQKAFISPKKWNNTAEVAEAARTKDPLALKAFDLTAQWLAIGLANAVTIIGPEAIFISGGLAHSGEILLQPTRKYFEDLLFPVLKNSVKLIPSALSEKGAGILGAAALGKMELT